MIRLALVSALAAVAAYASAIVCGLIPVVYAVPMWAIGLAATLLRHYGRKLGEL